MEQNNFVWTDENVKEYLRSITSVEGNDYWQQEINKFKASKQQSVSNGKDWKIVSLADTWNNGYTVYPFTSIPKDGDRFKIHSVKRLSDNEVFTMNQITNKGQITGIHIGRENELYFTCKKDHNTDYEVTINQLQKAKPIIFTTHDNVSMYEGQNYWRVLDFNKWLITNPSYVRGSNELYFSTEEAANEYILLNKPCLSVNDVNAYYNHLFNVKHDNMFMEGLKNCAQSKIKNQ